MNRIVLSKHKDHYTVYYNNKTFTYSINRYGPFALKLAKKTLKDGIKYYDYYRCYQNICVFFIYTRAYGVKKMIVDRDSVSILNKSKISVYKDHHARTYYAANKNDRIHRIVMSLKRHDGLVVDHINKNGLDNRTKNLRVVSVSINNRNTNVRKTNAFNCRGITEDQNSISCYWYDLNKKKRSKSFSKNKYGRDKAIEMAIQIRKQMKKENGYL